MGIEKCPASSNLASRISILIKMATINKPHEKFPMRRISGGTLHDIYEVCSRRIGDTWHKEACYLVINTSIPRNRRDDNFKMNWLVPYWERCVFSSYNEDKALQECNRLNNLYASKLIRQENSEGAD